MSNTRLTTVIRKDLQLADGQLAAQSAHICDNWLRTKCYNKETFSIQEDAWMKEPYISVLAVNSKEEMDFIYDLAKQKSLQVYEWSDILPSKVLNGQYLKYERIGISIGPADMDKIKEVTGTLPLY